MRIYQQREVVQAMEYAAEGGQALHLMSGSYAYLRKDTPNCFKGRSVIAHLFDRDKERLMSTARKLGVKVIKVEREGEQGQHIDLCGRPLERAKAMADQLDMEVAK